VGAKVLERFLVWLGVLVGMAGPFGILRIHDIRDWAQREPVHGYDLAGASGCARRLA
jgi:hypothetical protein